MSSTTLEPPQPDSGMKLWAQGIYDLVTQINRENVNLTFVDDAEIRIGNGALIAPNVTLTTTDADLTTQTTAPE